MKPESPLPFFTQEMMSDPEHNTFDLEVLTASDTASAIIVTGLTKEGQFSFNIATTADSLKLSTILNLPDVPIWLAVKQVTNTNRANDVFVSVWLRDNGTKVNLLCQGFVGDAYGVGYPAQGPFVPLQTRGKTTTITTTNPAAGAEVSITVPSGEYWIVKSFRVQLVTAVAVAVRQTHLRFTHRDGGIIEQPANNSQAASATMNYNFAQGAGLNVTAAVDSQGISIPSDIILPSGSVIATRTVAIQAADDYTAADLIIEKFYVNAL